MINLKTCFMAMMPHWKKTMVSLSNKTALWHFVLYKCTKCSILYTCVNINKFQSLINIKSMVIIFHGQQNCALCTMCMHSMAQNVCLHCECENIIMKIFSIFSFVSWFLFMMIDRFKLRLYSYFWGREWGKFCLVSGWRNRNTLG